MKAYDLPVTHNPLCTKKQVQEAVNQLCTPLEPFFSRGSALLHLGNSGAVYEERTARMEAFARPLWGLVPLTAGGGSSPLWETYVNGIRNGTNPAHEEYWGATGHVDQRFVEMAAIGLALCLCPDRVWDPLTDQEKANLTAWLDQINHFALPENNWRFFIVLANLGLKRAGGTYNQQAIDQALELLDTFYIADGWYSDGLTDQRDYYVPFAMHFYSLIYAALMGEEDPERAARYKDRAARFAQDFVYWFAEDGSALAFGRSLTYRFAQAGFWGAMAYAGVEALEWGVMKGLLLRNLRWWLAQPIFTPDGRMTIGYTYPNLLMAEGYNAPGSPYWAFKAFLPLALEDNHPFWTAEEKELPPLQSLSVQEHAYMVVTHNRNHVVALTSGQYAGFEPAHTTSKYAKFAYSNVFGFSVPKGQTGLSQGAYDSMLALSEGDDWFRVRQRCEEHRIEGTAVYSLWKPWANVSVRTWLIPAGAWHVRIHLVETDRELTTAEGGFAIRWEDRVLEEAREALTEAASGVLVRYPWGASGIIDLQEARTASAIPCEANTNLLHPRTLLPSLTGRLQPGVHLLVSAVIGTPIARQGEEEWLHAPLFKADEKILTVTDSRTKETLWTLPASAIYR
jgi:hypothetical protein